MLAPAQVCWGGFSHRSTCARGPRIAAESLGCCAARQAGVPDNSVCRSAAGSKSDLHSLHERARVASRVSSKSALPNVALQPTSASTSEALRLSAWKDASAARLVSRILSRPLAAELRR
jgi:hypothetical protein